MHHHYHRFDPLLCNSDFPTLHDVYKIWISEYPCTEIIHSELYDGNFVLSRLPNDDKIHIPIITVLESLEEMSNFWCRKKNKDPQQIVKNLSKLFSETKLPLKIYFLKSK